MRLFDELVNENKADLYDFYCRINLDFKNYERVTKKQMAQYAVDFYSVTNNIIDICTTKELSYLQEVIESKKYIYNKIDENQIIERYWPIRELRKKHLLALNEDKSLSLYEELVETIKKACKSYDKKQKAEKEKINEFLVGFYKAKAIVGVNKMIEIASPILEMSFEKIFRHIQYDKLFNFYVFLDQTDDYSDDEEVLIGTYGDYYNYSKAIDENRLKEKLDVAEKITFKKYQNIFYYEVDVDNVKIAKFLERCQNPFVICFVREEMATIALFNDNRSVLLAMLEAILDISKEESDSFCKDFEKAMDEVPSAVLNGFSPNEVKEARSLQKRIKKQRNSINKKQTSKSRLSQKDAEKFYKLWYGILDFINKKYKINEELTIYPKNETSGKDAFPIVEKFWEDFNNNIDEFCLKNPYKFTTQEIRMVQDFKRGIREVFTIIGFEQDYTIFAYEDKLYKVKSLLDNIDCLIKATELPVSVKCSLFPFNDQIVYDGLLIKYLERKISFEKEEKLLSYLAKGKAIYKL